MALNSSIQVPMPEHGAVKRKMGDKVYVYYATAVYRNEKGQPTSDRVSIGRYDKETGMLIPNRSYYEVYLKQPKPNVTGVTNVGVGIAFEEICKKIGLTKILKAYFPTQWKLMLTAAQYMLSEGNVMYYIGDYTEGHKAPAEGNIDDAQVSRLFSEIRKEDVFLFFREWMKNRKPQEYIAYDVTSFSSYGKHMERLEWGYNRDKEKLPQINLGMYYGEESGLPLYYRIYPGSISDKAHLQYMVADNEYINGKKTRFVMDRGFYSADNLRFLTEKNYRFVIALPRSLKYCTELIKKHGHELVNRSEHMLGIGLPYGKAYETEELGFRMKVHLYYDSEKALQESATLYDLLERQENDLKQMEEPPDRRLHYDKYFFINRSKDGKLAYVRNHGAIDAQLSKCGFFLIAETDFAKSTAEILDVYRRRDVVEKSFDDLKNEMDMKRLRCHSDKTVDGKTFVAFLSLIVRAYMLNRLHPIMRENGYPFRKILLELDKLQAFSLTPNVKARLLNPPSKFLRDVFLSLSVPCPVIPVCANSVGV